MTESNLYTPSPEVQAIHDKYIARNYGKIITQEEMDRWQLDLLYHYLGSLDEKGKRRARKTIKFLESRIVNQDYRKPYPENWQVGGIAA